ncbi:MAG TPA: hypothetical protein VFR38_02310 [Gaiellaceae bacterium]|nr:hypothetical protein [Gaiellaceae bacterium]
MRSARRTLSKRELALVAAALLLPVPLFAQSSLSLPLPGAVARGFGSLVTLEANDERSGTSARGRASETGANERRSGRASLAVTRAGGSTATSEEGSGEGGAGTAAESAGSQGAEDAPADGDPKGGDDTDDEGSPGSPGSTDTPAGDGGGGSQAELGASLTVAAPGTSTGVSVGAGGAVVDADVGADSGATEDDATVGASVEVTDTSGSSTGTGASVPSPGVSLP